jgi:phosphate starvation-inducible protein PhoH
VIVRKFPIEHLDPITLLGQNDRNLRHIERALPVRITLREGSITVAGDDEAVSTASRTIKELVTLAESGRIVEEADVETALGLGKRNGNGAAHLAQAYESAPGYVFDRKAVRPRTPMQASYLKLLEEHEVVFAIGPAGTGKTYLAVAAAVHALRQKKVDRIILVRPAVEAGESLGFLPGDMQEKVDPYLRPMYDALADLMSYDKMRRFLELGVIEIAPLAFMRGRTLHNSFVILDEGTEHDRAPDEDVPDAHGRELARRDHGRRHADRPQGPGVIGSREDPVDSSARCPTSSSSTSIPRTSCAIAWCATSSARSTTITHASTARPTTAWGTLWRRRRRPTPSPAIRRPAPDRAPRAQELQ